MGSVIHPISTSIIPSGPGATTAVPRRCPRGTILIKTVTDRGFVQAPTNPSPSPAAPPKKDIQTPQISPLEKRMLDMGPIRGDGSDKFFGMENVRLVSSSDGGDNHADLKCAYAHPNHSTEIPATATPFCNASTSPFLSARPWSITPSEPRWKVSRRPLPGTCDTKTQMRT